MSKVVRNKTLFIIISILLSINGFTQKRASIGLKFGYGLSRYFFVTDDFIHKDLISTDLLPLYEGGLMFNYVEGIMGIQIGALYTQKGWIETLKNESTREFKLDYIEIPILTHIRFGKNKKSNWVLNFGGFGAFANNLTVDTVGNFDPDLDKDFIDYRNPSYNNFEYGFKIGGGYEFGIGKNSLQLETMFTMGLRDLFVQDRVGIYHSLSQKLTISAIYKFTLFRKEEEIKK